MKDRLGQLLDENAVLSGITSRDPTLTDLELMAMAGCHVVWLDLEHAPLTITRAVELCRTITHLGMVPMARIIELTRTHVQALLDGGCQIVLMPNVQDAAQAEEFVRLGKFPPRGERGASSSAPGLDFNLGSDPQQKLREANAATHLMVQFESDTAFENLDDICAVDGIEMVTVGLIDWATSRGLFGEEAARLTHKIERVLSVAAETGKITAMGVGNPEQAARYVRLGVRLLFAGVDVNLKRRAFADALAMVKAAAG